MNPRSNRSITLIELLIAIALMSLIVLGFASIDVYGRYHVFTSDRWAQVQNEASHVLEHMAKNLSQAIGSLSNPGVDIHPSNNWIRVRWDRNLNGRPDDDGIGDWIAYRYFPGPNNAIIYNAVYPPSSFGWVVGGPQTISRRITSFTLGYIPSDNFVEVELTACWDPDGSPVACGTLDNPEVTMRTRMKMPSVSTN